jgi:hypothetical protein
MHDAEPRGILPPYDCGNHASQVASHNDPTANPPEEPCRLVIVVIMLPESQVTTTRRQVAVEAHVRADEHAVFVQDGREHPRDNVGKFLRVVRFNSPKRTFVPEWLPDGPLYR